MSRRGSWLRRGHWLRRNRFGRRRRGSRSRRCFLFRRALSGAGLLGRFFRRCRLGFLGRFLGRLFGGLLRRLLGFFCRFLRSLLRRLFRGFLLRDQQLFLGLLTLLGLFRFLCLSHRDPPVAADPCHSSVSNSPQRFQSALLRGQSISSIQAFSTQVLDRLSPNREARLCAPQELTCRWQSAPCIQYCPQQSYPA
jgi:hypothetical protein